MHTSQKGRDTMKAQESNKPMQPVIYAMDQDQCVWAQTGVLKPSCCLNAFDCLGCSLDARVLENFDEQRQAEGKSTARRSRMMLLMHQGKCRHMLSGRISYGLCSYGYNCVRCPFDQMLEDMGYLPNLKHPTSSAPQALT
jgi:hypothetical protein